MACDKAACGSCCGSCGSCSASCGSCGGREMFLSQQEIDILKLLAEVAFLPAARRPDTMEPHCREPGFPEDGGPWLEAMERKRLVSIDWDKPLKNFDYSAYTGLRVHGSFALTALGQTVVELLELQGVGGEAE